MNLAYFQIPAGMLLLIACLSLPEAVQAEEPVRQHKLLLDEEGDWVQETPPVPGTADGDLRLVRASLTSGDLKEASDGIDQWMDTWGEVDPLYPQAAITRAEIGIARRDYYQTHLELQEFLNQYAGSRYAERALDLEFVIAEVFLSGTKRKFWGMRILSADDVGISILDDISLNYPESPLADVAVKTKADFYYRENDFLLAEMEYSQLVKTFPRSRYVKYAMKRSADSALVSFNGIEFDDAPLIEAEEKYRDYLLAYPGVAEQEGVGQIIDEIQEKRAQKELEIGKYYTRAGHPKAAAFYYQSTIDHWPQSVAASQASRLLSELAVPEERGSFESMPQEEPAMPTLKEDTLQ